MSTDIEKQTFYGWNDVDVFDGYDVGTSWNGWHAPGFERDIAMEILRRSCEVNGVHIRNPRYDEGTDKIICEERATPDSEWITTWWKGNDYETADGKKHLYLVGSGEWTWSVKE